jgi:acyl-CoA thioester hydrolase
VFEYRIEPRFSETDALGHINNTVVPVWFEAARSDIFRMVHPRLTREDWPMILAGIKEDFVDQIHLGGEVTVKTGIQKIGTKSFTVGQLAYQHDKLVARGEATLVWFDYRQQASQPIPEDVRALLQPHLLENSPA